MKTRYLLPCPHCGEQLPIDTGQAGRTLVCRCGQSVEAPSMLGIRQLAPAPNGGQGADAEGARAWSVGRGLLFAAGVLLAVGALAGAIERLSQRMRLNVADRLPDAGVAFDESIDRMAIDEVLELWTNVATLSPGGWGSPGSAQARLRYQQLTRTFYELLGVAALGAGVAVVSVLWKRRRSSVGAAGYAARG